MKVYLRRDEARAFRMGLDDGDEVGLGGGRCRPYLKWKIGTLVSRKFAKLDVELCAFQCILGVQKKTRLSVL